MAANVEQLAERLIEAFNSRDIDRLADVVDENAEFEFGHKTLHGRQEVEHLVKRQLYGTGYRVSHGRRFRRDDELVAESRQELSYVDDGESASFEELAALYVARDGRLTRYAEFPDLASAFAASSVAEDDELRSA